MKADLRLTLTPPASNLRPQPGDIAVPRGRKVTDRGVDRVVVYRVAKHGSVFYDSLDGRGGGAVCHGHGSVAHFLSMYEVVGQMRFEGAHQLYRRERDRHARLRWWTKHLRDLLEKALDGRLP